MTASRTLNSQEAAVKTLPIRVLAVIALAMLVIGTAAWAQNNKTCYNKLPLCCGYTMCYPVNAQCSDGRVVKSMKCDLKMLGGCRDEPDYDCPEITYHCQTEFFTLQNCTGSSCFDTRTISNRCE
jgi:hypothetical protein